jgi:RNA polymerase subunit RPABC4/transcription elongation factor Spt4
MDLSNAKACVKCGNFIEKMVNFCPSCGSSQETFITCKQCGRKVSIGAKFCSGCGTKDAGYTFDDTTHSINKNNDEEKVDSQSTVWSRVRKVLFYIWILVVLGFSIVLFMLALKDSGVGGGILGSLSVFFYFCLLPMGIYHVIRWIIYGKQSK